MIVAFSWNLCLLWIWDLRFGDVDLGMHVGSSMWAATFLLAARGQVHGVFLPQNRLSLAAGMTQLPAKIDYL